MKTNLNVLIVEDSESDADLIVRYLQKGEYIIQSMLRVETPSEMREALNGNNSFDIVFSDYQMPSFNAIEALTILREMTFDFPFIVISGSIGEETAVDMMKSGADDYLIKGNLAKLSQLTKRALVDARNRKELKEAEALVNLQREKLMASAKMSALGEVASVIAHEINNPLAVITGRINLLLRQLDSDQIDPEQFKEKIKQNLEQISGTANRIAKIVKGVKTISRNAENDQMEMVSLKSIIDDTLELCSDKFKGSSVDLRVQVNTSDDTMIEGRATQLTQVLLNLLTNTFDAVVATSEKWVSLKVVTGLNGVVISVTDCGHGIPAQVLAKMMEPFFTTKGAGNGTGLGLSISKNIVQEHNGQLYYDQNSLNTCFVIKLPFIQKTPMSSDEG